MPPKPNWEQATEARRRAGFHIYCFLSQYFAELVERKQNRKIFLNQISFSAYVCQFDRAGDGLAISSQEDFPFFSSQRKVSHSRTAFFGI